MKNKKQKNINRLIVSICLLVLTYSILLYIFVVFLGTENLLGLIISSVFLLLTTIVIGVLIEIGNKRNDYEIISIVINFFIFGFIFCSIGLIHYILYLH